MRILGLSVIVVAGTLWIAAVGAQDEGNSSGQAKVQKSSDRVKELHKERVAALKDLAETEAALHKIGRGSLEETLEAKVLVAEAEVDAAETEADRVTVLKSLVQVLKECEEFARARKHNAQATEAAVLKAKARRLAAEIRLEQAQAQVKEPGQAKHGEPGHEKVVITKLQAKDVDIAEQFVCQINSHRQISVRPLQRGYVEEVLVKEGQTVKQGDLMFRLERQLLNAKLDAELAEVKVAALTLKTTERLFEKKVVSADEVAVLQAKLAGAEARAKVVQAELAQTMIRAPFDGIVSRLNVQQGGLVTEGEALTTLCDNSEMWVYFNVPQEWYIEHMSSASKDHAVELMLAGGRKLPQPGKIGAIDAQFDNQTGTIPIRADFPNPDSLLRHGMTGTVQLHRKLSSAITIPKSAALESQGKRFVYVVDKDDIAHLREIVIQNEVPDAFVIKQGLEAGDRIVVDGLRDVDDGEKVK